MDEPMSKTFGPLAGISRRQTLAVAGLTAAGAFAPVAAMSPSATSDAEDITNGLVSYEPVRSELVMNLLVTCSAPEPMGSTTLSSDGQRSRFWPIVGGRFWGKDISGDVVPGGADYPVVRPDGVVVVDAFYRLREDDGTSILIHNKGFAYPGVDGEDSIYRLSPVFTTVEGPHDWLMKSIFVATLIYGDDVPDEYRMAEGPNENDRLIQVHRLF